MSITVSGILKTPAGNLLANTEIKFHAVATAYSVLQGTTGIINTGADGSYSVTLQEGSHRVTVRQGNTRPEVIGMVHISAETTATTLNELLLAASAASPGNPLADAILAAVERAESAASTIETKSAEAVQAATSQAANHAAAAQSERVLAEQARTGAQTAEANAVAVVTGGTASLAPEPGKIPIAGASGKIHGDWLDYTIPALSAQYPGLSVVAQCFYDTSKDSNPDWIYKTAELSYGKEARPAGRYLGQFATTTLAGASPNAAVGDWYYNTNVRAFYELTSLVGDGKEIFRAGSAHFPSQVLGVAEADRVILFDASGPELTMWMVIYPGNLGYLLGRSLVTRKTIAMQEGWLIIGGSYTSNISESFCVANFITEEMYYANYKLHGDISKRHLANNYTTDTRFLTINLVNIRGVAITVLPNAPIDPQTGLKVPTIAAATNGGVTVFKDDRSVMHLMTTHGVMWGVVFNLQNNLIIFGGSGVQHRVFIFDALPGADSNTPTRIFDEFSIPKRPGKNANTGSVSKAVAVKKGWAINQDGLPEGGITLLYENPADPAKGMVAHITDTCNTGWMVGDTKAVLLSNTEAGAVIAPELVVNGTFDTDTSGWTADSGASLSYEATFGGKSGIAKTSNNSTSGVSHYQTITGLVVGKQYRVKAVAYAPSTNTQTNSATILMNLAAGQKRASVSVEDQWSDIYLSFVADSATENLYFNSTTNIGNVSTGDVAYFDSISVKEVEEDRSGNNNHLNIHGTLTKAPVAPGSELMAYSGFSASNFLSILNTLDLDVGTGDFFIKGWFTCNDVQATGFLFSRYVDTDTKRFSLAIGGGVLKVRFEDANNPLDTTLSETLVVGRLYFLAVSRVGTRVEASLNAGTVYTSDDARNAVDLSDAGNTQITRLGQMVDIPHNGSMALWHISRTVPSADQIAKIYADEKRMIEGKALLDGNDPAIKALAYDKGRDLLHAASQGVVSSFRGLERVASTLDEKPELVVNGTFDTDLSGWVSDGGTMARTPEGRLSITTQAIAWNGAYTTIAVEEGKVYRGLAKIEDCGGGTAGVSISQNHSSAKFAYPSTQVPKELSFIWKATFTGTLYVEINHSNQTTTNTIVVSSVSVKEVTPAAPITALAADDGLLTITGTNGVDFSRPAMNVRERLAKASRPRPGTQREDFFFTANGTDQDFPLPKGWKPKRVWVDGAKKRSGSAEDYTVKFDGFVYSVSFAVAPALNAEIDVEAVDA